MQMDGKISAISIGVPLYNAEEYLDACLNCILQQSFSDFEVIISDNCSTDATLEIIQKFASEDPRINIFRQKENIGPGNNFAFVLEHASGDYFLWRAYDDLSDENYLQELMTQLIARPDAGLAVPNIIGNNPDGREVFRYTYRDFAGAPGFWRDVRLLHSLNPAWIYGLFRTPDIQKAFARAREEFDTVWGQDHLVIQQFAMERKIVGSNATSFYQMDTGKSEQIYRQADLGDQWRNTLQFIRFSYRTLKKSRLSLLNKCVMFPFILTYANGKIQKYRRLIRGVLYYPFTNLWNLMSK